MNRAALSVLAMLAFQPGTSSSLVVPNVPDLTITTRVVRPGPPAYSTSTTIRLKGARQRIEWSIIGGASGSISIHLTQCDARRSVLLNPERRTYGVVPIAEPPVRSGDVSGYVASGVVVRSGSAQAPAEQHVTIDAVDTGERRQFGRLTARHVVTTTTTEIGGSAARTITHVQDGWYVDLPDPSCRAHGEEDTVLVGYLAASPHELQPPRITQRGRAKRGYPLIETSRIVTPEGTSTIVTELVEISDRPLDPSLFDVPRDYRPALPLWHGGFDISRPDTYLNRAVQLWETARGFAERFWR